MKKILSLLVLVFFIFGIAVINSCKKDPVLPTLKTNNITNITINSATAGGEVTANGGEEVTARGVCWSTTRNPTIKGSRTTDGKGIGSFVSNITSLDPNTLYYVRAYATNSVGTAYGNEVTFTSTPIVVATLTTTAVTSVTLTAAVSGGDITLDGNAPIIAKGVCWSTTANPTISDDLTSDGTGTGSFTSNLSGLSPSTTYYVRAYATNSAGTAYGNEVSFTTGVIVIPTLTTDDATSITLTSAVSGGIISTDGGGAVTAKGVCWSTTANPTISDDLTLDGTGTGSFTSNLSGLSPDVTYYVRAYATNSAGTAYGNEVSFTTSAIVIPTLTTVGATSITLTTAASGGNITANGGGAVTARGVCWSTTANPTISDDLTSDGTGIGSFVSAITGLAPETTYHVRAYATNSSGTAYGSDVSFTTNAVGVPSLATTSVTSITQTTAVSGGNITADGGGAVTAKGVCWSTATDPTISDDLTSDGSGTGTYVSNLTGLLPGTTYYVRAYATNSAGTAYGNEVSFTAGQIVIPTLTTTTITSITTTTAVSGGNVLANGGGTVTGRGVCWSTTADPTIGDFVTDDGSGTGTYVSNLTGLIPGTEYHVRAYAVNSAGTAYGNDVTFTALVALPTLTTTTASSITETTAVSGGEVTDSGGGAITERGTCWATTENPTISDSRTSDATGTGAFVSNLTGLQPGTTYHIRAYATNSSGTAYGSDITFTTVVALSTLNTDGVTSITQTTAVSGGSISDDGGGTIIAKGVCWSTTTSPTTGDSYTTDGTGTGSFTSSLTGLSAGTTYYVRAYATNNAGTAYGDEESFDTDPVEWPAITTNAVTSISVTAAGSGGIITSDGGGAITAKGVCWATSTAPTLGDSFTTDGTGSGSFTSSLTGLSAGTTYYVRAYATNSAGTEYGNEVSFNTQIADIDGNTYNTVNISSQVWMAENLKTTKYNNDVLIGTTDPSGLDLTLAVEPKYQWAYDGDEGTVDTYGRLYTWHTVTDSRGICPTGWRVPTDAEFESLKGFLGGEPVAGGKLKETGETHWQTPNTGATDEFGFTALPGGYRTVDGGFVSMGLSSYFWSSTEDAYVPANGYGQGLLYNAATWVKGGFPKNDGIYVRCIKD